MPNNRALRDHVVELLRGGHAHAAFDRSVEGFPVERAGVRPKGLEHSAWELLEHIRIAQNDIVQFSISGQHVSPAFPEGYWPASPEPRNAAAWEESVRLVREDLAEMERLVIDPERDLVVPFSWGDGQTLLREALMLADHNAYHLGQLVMVRRALGTWPG
jgi:hypothetical protein